MSLMESSILSEVDDTSILRTGLPSPLWPSSQLATGLSPLAPRSGLERSDFVLWHLAAVPACPGTFPLLEVDRQYCADASPSQFVPNRTPHYPLISRRRRFTGLHASENTRSAVVTANQPTRLRAADGPRP